ncbi:MAG: helix-turn-helix domain-containing protein [Campylobacter sp.]|nr:helix-turn-helix domain-containing protein [Campylobacter sp.]
MKTIGEKLRDLRTAYGLSQSQFGDKLGITRGSINSYENNVNPLTTTAKYKILQATGIGFEYFDTDMELWEAFAKFGLNPTNLKLKSLTETIISFFYGLEAFVNGETSELKFISAKIQLLDFLANFENASCVFVKIKGNIAEPFAKNGDIIAVLQDEYPNNKNWVIARFNDNIFVAQYFFSGNDEITLKLSDDEKFKFSVSNFKNEVEILGIVKARISIENF